MDISISNTIRYRLNVKYSLPGNISEKKGYWTPEGYQMVGVLIEKEGVIVKIFLPIFSANLLGESGVFAGY